MVLIPAPEGGPARGSSGIEDFQVSPGVTVVFPLFVENHLEARPNGVVTVRMTGRGGWDADPFELLGRDGADRMSDLVHALAA